KVVRQQNRVASAAQKRERKELSQHDGEDALHCRTPEWVMSGHRTRGAPERDAYDARRASGARRTGDLGGEIRRGLARVDRETGDLGDFGFEDADGLHDTGTIDVREPGPLDPRSARLGNPSGDEEHIADGLERARGAELR